MISCLEFNRFVISYIREECIIIFYACYWPAVIFYVLSLVKSDSVFTVNSDRCLNYSTRNRKWYYQALSKLYQENISSFPPQESLSSLFVSKKMEYDLKIAPNIYNLDLIPSETDNYDVFLNFLLYSEQKSIDRTHYVC